MFNSLCERQSPFIPLIITNKEVYVRRTSGKKKKQENTQHKFLSRFCLDSFGVFRRQLDQKVFNTDLCIITGTCVRGLQTWRESWERLTEPGLSTLTVLKYVILG